MHSPSARVFGHVLISVFLLTAFAFSYSALADLANVSAPPHIIAWAWERDEDLSYLNPSQASVAYFAGNVFVRGSLVSFRPRTQTLKLPDDIDTMPVFRIETIRNGAQVPELRAATLVAKTIAGAIEKTSTRDWKKSGPLSMVQIDFDALADERFFYRQLLNELRKELPQSTKISITALASWLLSDRWLEQDSADEAVAMLFSIGPERQSVLTRLRKQALSNGVNIPICIGISAGEKDTNRAIFKTEIQKKTKRLYLFSSRPWTDEKFRIITREALGQ